MSASTRALILNVSTKVRPSAVGAALPGVLLASLLVTACQRDSCFVAGTLVSTPDGPRVIESLRVGELVWSYAFAERRPVARPLIAVHRALVREARRVELDNGGAIRGISPTHPVYSPGDSRYLPASRLSEGDVVATYRGESEPGAARVARVVATEVATPTLEVFNLSVAGDDQNYFADGVLVHNKSPFRQSCTAADVKAEVVAVDASAGRYAVRVTVGRPQSNDAGTQLSYFVGEGGDVHCDSPTATTATVWTCAMKPLAAGRHELYVSGYAAAAEGGSCSFEIPLSLVVGPPGATDGGATDGGATDGGATDGGATDGGATDGAVDAADATSD